MTTIETRKEGDHMTQKPEPPHPRTLESEIPELKPFLTPGATVLDVGCGLGTITMGVAEAVKPGAVVGIEPVKARVDVAREWATANPQTKNISFQVGDSHHLDFSDNTFDVVYSHTVLHFFLEPVMGLKEQKRVAKKGGWIIASGVRDMSFTYPHCPHWDKLFEAYRRYWVARLEDYRKSGKDPVAFYEEQNKINPSYAFYYDMQAGRKCAEWFHKAGLVDVRIEVQPRRVKYQGHEDMKPYPTDFLVLEEPQTDVRKAIKKQFTSDYQRMIAMGLLDEETLKLAIEEARAFYNDPGAFQFWLEVFAAGRAK